MNKIKSIVLLILALLPFSLQAKDGDHNLSAWKFGDTIHGEKPTNKYLKGKVVVIEDWGVR